MDNNQTLKVRFTGHLTENYQLQSADKLISKLRTDIAANECYIMELEDKRTEDSLLINKLQSEINLWQERYKKLSDKYSSDVNEFIKTDILYAKYQQEIQELKEERNKYRDQRDRLIYQISQLQ